MADQDEGVRKMRELLKGSRGKAAASSLRPAAETNSAPSVPASPKRDGLVPFHELMEQAGESGAPAAAPALPKEDVKATPVSDSMIFSEEEVHGYLSAAEQKPEVQPVAESQPPAVPAVATSVTDAEPAPEPAPPPAPAEESQPPAEPQASAEPAPAVEPASPTTPPTTPPSQEGKAGTPLADDWKSDAEFAKEPPPVPLSPQEKEAEAPLPTPPSQEGEAVLRERQENALLSGDFSGFTVEEAMNAVALGVSHVFRDSRDLQERLARLNARIDASFAMTEARRDPDGKVIRQKLEDVRRDIGSLREAIADDALREKLGVAINAFAELGELVRGLKDGIQKGVNQLGKAVEVRTDYLAGRVEEVRKLARDGPPLDAVRRVDYWGGELKRGQKRARRYLWLLAGGTIALMIVIVWSMMFSVNAVRNDIAAPRETAAPTVFHGRCLPEQMLQMPDGTTILTCKRISAAELKQAEDALRNVNAPSGAPSNQ